MVLAGLALGCSGDMWQGCTSTVVGTTVETTKEVSSGIAEGIEEGRKSGESMDGARLVTTMDELTEVGGVSVYALETDGETGTTITLAFENTLDGPLRVVGPELEVLDTDGFVARPTDDLRRELTIPPQAKDKATARVPITPDQVATVRLWGQALELPAE